MIFFLTAALISAGGIIIDITIKTLVIFSAKPRVAKEQFQLPGALAAAENLICASKQRTRGLPLFVRYPLQPFVLDIVREQCSPLLRRSLKV